MSAKIKIGSRGSDLALWQANFVKNQLENLGQEVEINIIKTKGDKIQHLSFDKIEGKGFFTKEIEQALLEKKVDLAVHSHKDLETNSPSGLSVVAVSEREDPSELLLINKDAVDHTQLWDLKKGAIVGTSSARRKSQMLFFREDVTIKDLRGNVPTRVEKLKNRNYDAILLAYAGVSRLGLNLSDFHVVKLPVKWFIPAPAQGVLALQIRENDYRLKELLNKINSDYTQQEISIERKVLNLLDGGCQLPLGVYCQKKNNQTNTWVSIVKPGEKSIFRFHKKNTSAIELVRLINRQFKNDKNVFISRNLTDQSFFTKSLKDHKINVIGNSLIEINFLDLEHLPASDWIFFSSVNSVLSIVENHKADVTNRKIAAIGKTTATKLHALGLKVDFIGNGNPKKVAYEFSKILGIEKVFFPVSSKSLRTVQSQIPFEQLLEQVSYTAKEKTKVIANCDLYVFTSPSNVHSFFNTNEIDRDQHVIAIGPSTRDALYEYGIQNIEVSWESSELSLSDSVIAFFYSN